jgi:hypothetical protein
MNDRKRGLRAGAWATLVPNLLLGGCTFRGAPSYALFGAYFPLWLLSGVIGMAGALVAHRLFVATGWVRVIPYQLSVCTAIGFAVAALIWLSGTEQL